MAGETMELAKPVIGTRVPAPVCRAMSSNTWQRVRMAVKKISVTEVMPRAWGREKPICCQSSQRNCPKQQIPPPDKKAHKKFFPPWEGGDAFFTMLAYSFEPIPEDMIGKASLSDFCSSMAIKKPDYAKEHRKFLYFPFFLSGFQKSMFV